MRRVRPGFLALAAVALLATALAPAPARAEPTAFGSRTLEVPLPAGFVPLSRGMPRYIAAAQAYLPAGNRLVEVYVPVLDAQKLHAGMPASVRRYYQLQVLRAVDGKTVSVDEFAKLRDAMESELAAVAPTLDAEAAKLSEQGNAALAERTDTKVSLGQVRHLGVFRKKDWGLFFSNSVGVSVAQGDASEANRVLSASGIVLVDGQVMYLFAYANEADPDARRWAEGAVSMWADAVLAANPGTAAAKAPAESAGAVATDSGSTSFADNRLGWAALVALVGAVLATLLLRRRKR